MKQIWHIQDYFAWAGLTKPAGLISSLSDFNDLIWFYSPSCLIQMQKVNPLASDTDAQAFNVPAI